MKPIITFSTLIMFVFVMPACTTAQNIQTVNDQIAIEKVVKSGNIPDSLAHKSKLTFLLFNKENKQPVNIYSMAFIDVKRYLPDSVGIYHVSLLPGKYKVKISAVGFKSLSVPLKIEKGYDYSLRAAFETSSITQN